MQSLTVGLAALDLDLNNPRINPAEHQTEALRLILLAESIGDRVGEKVFALAKSICELGSTDPSEKLVVLLNPQSPGRYTVLDGNRRVSALRLLTEPSLLEREDIGIPASMRRRIQALRSQYDVSVIPQTLEITIFPSRDAAEPFLALKHTGERDGAGRSAWSAMQQARFEMTGAYQLLVRLRADQLLNAETNRQLESSEFSISTFTRVAASSEFSSRFGGRISSDAYDEGTEAVLATSAWSRIANDTASGEITSRTHSTGEEIRPYLDGLRAELTPQIDPSDTEIQNQDPYSAQPPPAKPQGGSPISPGAKAGAAPALPPSAEPGASPGTGTGGQTDPTTAPPPAKVRAPRVRHYLIDRRAPLPVTHQKCRKIQDELMDGVKVSDAPYAAAFLVRAFVELTAHFYLIHFSIQLPKHATDKIQAMAQDLMSQPRMAGEPADRKTIGIALQRDANMYEDLSVAAHNVHANLSPDHVRATWESVQPGLRLAWQRIAESRGAGQSQSPKAE